MGKLVEPEFLAAISFLVENGATKFHTRRILIKYDSQFRRSGISITITDAIVQAWKRLWIYSSDIEKSLS
jgi:hypothetical protein